MKTIKIYVDEAGRGPLAGPVYVGLLLPLTKLTSKQKSPFKDSKILSEPKREECFRILQDYQEKRKLLFSSGSATNKEIDRYGMTRALNLSIMRGLYTLLKSLYEDSLSHQIKHSLCSCDHLSNLTLQNYFREQPNYTNLNVLLGILKNEFQLSFQLVIDGNRTFGLEKSLSQLSFKTVIDGDAKIKEVSMASIIAKVSRDKVMKNYCEKYPQYLFDQHKGYGTKLHYQKIEEYGVSPLHRKLFLKKIYPNHKIRKYKEI